MNALIESKPRYEILDGLRGVAALLVVAFHLLEAYASDHTTQIVNHGYPLYMIHFPFVYVFHAWKNAHEAAPLGTHVFSGVSIGLLAVAVAWASFKLCDLPVRKWLSGLGTTKERGDR